MRRATDGELGRRQRATRLVREASFVDQIIVKGHRPQLALVVDATEAIGATDGAEICAAQGSSAQGSIDEPAHTITEALEHLIRAKELEDAIAERSAKASRARSEAGT